MASELEEKVSAIDDITDSEAFDEVLIHLDKIKMEDEDFLENVLSRQQDMIISWRRPWYQQSNCLTKRVFDNEVYEREGTEKEIEKFLTGPLSSDEITVMEKNWKQLVKLFDLPDKPICLARWKNTNKCKNPKAAEESARRFIISFLAQGLQRNLHQVYKHFVIHYGFQARGFYTPFEEKIMSICLYHLPKNPVPAISLILERDPRGIYKRIQQQNSEVKKFEKRKWTLPLAAQLLKLLMKHTDLPLNELKNKQFNTSVWRQIQEEMEYDYVNLQFYWYNTLHTQLFIRRDVKRNRLRKKIFKRLRQMPYKYWSDIRWKEVAKFYRDGFTKLFLYRTCYTSVRKHENFIRTPLQDLITFALNNIKSSNSKRLKTLILNDNGELEEYRYNKTDIEV